MKSLIGILFLYNFFLNGTKQNCVSEFKSIGNKYSFSLPAYFLLISEKEDLFNKINILPKTQDSKREVLAKVLVEHLSSHCVQLVLLCVGI